MATFLGSAGSSGSWSVAVSTTGVSGWLSASAPSGSGSGNVTVSLNAAGLTAGTYYGSVTVSYSAGGRATAPVTLQVNPMGGVGLDGRPTFNFSGQVGASNPAPQHSKELISDQEHRFLT